MEQKNTSKIKKYNRLVPILYLFVSLILSCLLLFSCVPRQTTFDPAAEETPLAEITQKALDQREIEIDQIIGELIILGFRGTEVDRDSKIIQDISDYHIGGIILFDYDVPSKSTPRNITSPMQAKKLVQDIKKMGRSDLFIAIDAEGGRVNRLKPKYGFMEIISPQSMGEIEPEESYLKAMPLGLEMDYLGINVNFAPVVDVNVNPENPVIGQLERSFSKDPEIVIAHARSFIDAMHAFSIIAAIKHFPGHGSSTEDSHIGMVDITDTYDQETELMPYQKLIQENKVDMIMTAHIMNRAIDPDYPATLSAKFLQDILRGELQYQGIIVSDDMQMGAIVEHYGFEEAIIQAINAGCDLLIFSNNGSVYDEDIAHKVFYAIQKALQDGQIQERTLRDAYERIQTLKVIYGIK